MLTSELIAAIENSISVPTYRGRYDTDDLISLCNEEIKAQIMPFITSLRQHYFLASEEISIISGIQDYKIPKRALGRTIYDMKFKNTNNYEINLPIKKLSFVAGDQSYTSETPDSWAVIGDKVRLYPIPTTGSIIMYYTMRHSKVVDDSRGVTVQSITNIAPNSFITVQESSVPANIEAGSRIDITENEYGYSITHKDLLVSAVAGNLIFLQDYNDITLLENVSINSKVSTAEETILLQFPEEAHPVLIEAVCGRILKGLGYAEQENLSKSRLFELKTGASDLMNPRIEIKTEKIVPRNGVLRNRLGRRFPKIGVIP